MVNKMTLYVLFIFYFIIGIFICDSLALLSFKPRPESGSVILAIVRVYSGRHFASQRWGVERNPQSAQVSDSALLGWLVADHLPDLSFDYISWEDCAG